MPMGDAMLLLCGLTEISILLANFLVTAPMDGDDEIRVKALKERSKLRSMASRIHHTSLAATYQVSIKSKAVARKFIFDTCFRLSTTFYAKHIL